MPPTNNNIVGAGSADTLVRTTGSADATDHAPLRFEFADDKEPVSRDTTGRFSEGVSLSANQRSDLEMVEELLERCWQEIGASDLTVKMTDIVRLLEFRNKMRPAAEAERVFWSLIDRMRREELAGFGDPSGVDV